MTDELSTSSLVSHGLTWLVANGSSIGTVFLWLTKPLRDRLDRIEKEVFGDPRSSSAEIAGPAELTRRVADLEHELRALRDQLARTVTDDEFRGYISVANQKSEKLLETLGFIRGRLKGLRPDDD
jgi:Mg2+ and Co2+ transporter CorA